MSGRAGGNPHARALYERLGYRAYDRRPDAWEEQAPDETLHRHETMCTMMRKDLSKDSALLRGRPPTARGCEAGLPTEPMAWKRGDQAETGPSTITTPPGRRGGNRTTQ